MPDNRSVILGSTGLIVVAAVLRLWAPSCPAAQASAAAEQWTDPKWGTATNVAILHRGDGDVMEATPTDGMHRVVELVTVPAAGRYRLAVETTFAGASELTIEIGDADQPKYAILSGDMRAGRITARKGDIVAAGVEPVAGKPRHYRWWVDMDYVAGQALYNLAFSMDGSREFAGNAGCKIVLNGSSFTPLPE
jgi:hypothetical protein